MHLVIYALVEATTEDEALSVGRAVFDRLVGDVSNAGAVFDYSVAFDEEDTTVAGKARWGELPVAARARTARRLSTAAGWQPKRSSNGISTE